VKGMGLLGFLKKKPKKDFATIDEVKGPRETVEISDKPLKKAEIHEIGGADTEAQALADVTPDTENLPGMGMFSSEEMGAVEATGTGVTMKLEEAMERARKYLIVHAQIPNGILPQKSSKRENGTFYFEFKDRELHRIELDQSGEVTDWEREKL